MRTRHVATGLGLLATAGLLAACSSAATSGAASAGEHSAANGFSSGTTTAGSAASAPTAITIGMPPTADVQRAVRAAYTVPSGTFLTAFDGVIARAVGLGGYVASSATIPAPGGRIVAGSVTLQIPSASLASFLNGMPSTFVASSIDFSSV